MNINTANNMIQKLSTGTFVGADWFGPAKAQVYFKGSYARNTVADYGQLLGSGPRVEETMMVTDRHLLRALRKITA
jgi:hypothetical protein